MQQKSQNEIPKVFVLLGPTGSGKTKLLSQLDIDRYEVVSCDSRQIYKGLEISTAAPPKNLQKDLIHHLVSICSPKERFTAGQFVTKASVAIYDIVSRNKIPILAGGSGFYFRALKTGMFPIATPPEVRKKVEQILPETRLKLLQEIDPKALCKDGILKSGCIHPNDNYRITRALEIIYASGGKKWTTFWLNAHQKREKFCNQFHFSGFWIDIVPHEHRISLLERAKKMVKEGIIEEVGAIYEKYSFCAGLSSLGCQEALAVYLKQASHTELAYKIAQSHYHYVKKQRTWLKKENSLDIILSEEFLKKLDKL